MGSLIWDGLLPDVGVSDGASMTLFLFWCCGTYKHGFYFSGKGFVQSHVGPVLLWRRFRRNTPPMMLDHGEEQTCIIISVMNSFSGVSAPVARKSVVAQHMY